MPGKEGHEDAANQRMFVNCEPVLTGRALEE